MAAEIDPEEFWSAVLSGDPDKVRAAWPPLDPEAREAVRRHLENMAAAPERAPAQKESAARALMEIKEVESEAGWNLGNP